VPHLHIHVIPRYKGDVADPRGGIRHVIPGKGNYLADDVSSAKTEVGLTLAPRATRTRRCGMSYRGDWQERKCIDVLASFVQLSGLDVIEERLFEAIRNDGRVRILVSDYLYISDAKALWRLMGWINVALEEFNEPRLQAKLIETSRLPSSPSFVSSKGVADFG
jgi:hypothetical protein